MLQRRRRQRRATSLPALHARQRLLAVPARCAPRRPVPGQLRRPGLPGLREGVGPGARLPRGQDEPAADLRRRRRQARGAAPVLQVARPGGRALRRGGRGRAREQGQGAAALRPRGPAGRRGGGRVPALQQGGARQGLLPERPRRQGHRQRGREAARARERRTPAQAHQDAQARRG